MWGACPVSSSYISDYMHIFGEIVHKLCSDYVYPPTSHNLIGLGIRITAIYYSTIATAHHRQTSFSMEGVHYPERSGQPQF